MNKPTVFVSFRTDGTIYIIFNMDDNVDRAYDIDGAKRIQAQLETAIYDAEQMKKG